jgi:hypothetical protein
MRFLLISLCLIPLVGQAKTSKVICELEGTYSVSYKDVKKKYLSDGIELFKNLARQSQASLFLLKRAKTNFAAEDWEKDKIYIVQYWEVDSEKETFKSLKYTLEPSTAWINPEASWNATAIDTGISVEHSMEQDEVHSIFPDYKVDIYNISNKFNWYTGKGQISGDIWLKKTDGSKNRNPKVEIFAKGKCETQKKKF